MRRRKLLQLGAGSVTALSAGALTLGMPHIANAQAKWPTKPVRVIVPFAAGGGTDAIARPWADKLGQIFGQPFVIENRGGASGIIGTEAVVRSPPDGYTLLISSNTSTVNLPLMRSIPYDTKQLEPIARVGDAITGFAIHPAVGVKSLQEMLDYAKKNPGKLTFGSSGAGTTTHLRLEMLKFRTGVDILHVPYRGGADSLIDVLSNNVNMMNEPVVNPHCKAGKLILLNINHKERSPEFPDVKTLTELGYPDSDVAIWVSLWAPTGVPADIKQRLNEAIVSESKLPAMSEKLRIAGSAAVVMSIPELEAFREQEYQQMADLVKRANIRIE